MDLTGFGETNGVRKAGDFDDSDGKEESDAVIANLLGRTLVGMRAEDILACSRWLAARFDAKAIELRAANWAVTPALHAAAAEPNLFNTMTLADRPMTWHQVIEKGERHRFSDLVHGALREYDLPDLERAIQDAIKARK